MSQIISQSAFGVLTLTSNHQPITTPQATYNPRLEDLPGNPFSVPAEVAEQPPVNVTVGEQGEGSEQGPAEIPQDPAPTPAPEVPAPEAPAPAPEAPAPEAPATPAPAAKTTKAAAK